MTQSTPASATGVRRKSIGGNFMLNFMGILLPLGVSLAVVPLYIHRIGSDRYGIMSLVWMLLGYFGFLDFGLSRSSANALSRLAHAGPAERGPVLITALYLNIGLGCVGGAIMYCAGLLMAGHMAALSGPLHAEILASLPWIACMLPLSMISGVGIGAIESREGFVVSNLLNSFGGVLGQVLPITCAILFGPRLTVIIPAALAARGISTLCVLAYVAWNERPLHPRQFDRSKVRPLLGYGAWVSVTGMISPMLETADQMLIGALLGPGALAHYSVPMNLVTRSQLVAAALAKTLFPRMSRLEHEEADHLTVRSTVSLAYGFAAICAPAIILAGPFLTLWLGAPFAATATPVALILLVGGWTNGVAFIPFTFLQSQGRPDLAAKIHLCEILPFLGAVWLLTKWFGLPGAAIAWSLRVTIDLALMLIAGRLIRPGILVMLPAIAIIGGSYAFAQIVKPAGLFAFVVACLVGLAIVGGALIWDSAARALFSSTWTRLRPAAAPAG